LTDCGFSPRTFNLLRGFGKYHLLPEISLQQVAELGLRKLSLYPGVGKATLTEVEGKIAEFGLTLNL
ncbi:MAG: hypothetical protein VKM97_07215, partial [Cyanobacteriota bacterium]|nr:hypothetical protein [Cyanobacteriota bacterium]